MPWMETELGNQQRPRFKDNSEAVAESGAPAECGNNSLYPAAGYQFSLFDFVCVFVLFF
jgi:hypothetical protein